MTAEISAITPTIGGEIAGLSGQELTDPEGATKWKAALATYGVLVFKEIDISDEDLVAFSKLLGKVVIGRTREHELPEIATITLDPTKTDALLAWYRQGNFLWHIDGAADELPQRATLLTAREVDETGGDTEFASTYAAFDSLPRQEREAIDGLRVVHSFATAQLLAHPEATAQERAGWDQTPTRVHPLVWTHGDGRKSLLLGATASQVVGWSAEASRALLDHLLEWSTREEYRLRHRWHRGDLVMWDNTGMLHRALPFQPTSRRLMHRTTLIGEEMVT